MHSIVLIDHHGYSQLAGNTGPVYLFKKGIKGIQVESADNHLKFRFNDKFSCARELLKKHTSSINIIFCNIDKHPLPPDLITNFKEHMALTNAPYAHADGQVFGIPDLSIEGISREGVNKLSLMKEKYLPNGLMNGYCIEGAEPYWWTRKQTEYYLKDHASLYQKPRSVSIEATAACNLHCLKCHCQSPLRTDQRRYEGPARMSFENWKIIIDKFSAEYPGIPFSPAIRGEALLHPQIVEMVEYAAKKGHSASFFTNGNLLTPDISKRLIEAGLSSLTVSLDANDPDLYRSLQPGGDFNRVVENVEAFLKLRRGKTPAIGMHFVESPENSDIFDAYLRRWFGKVDFVSKSICLDFLKGHRPWKLYSKPKHRIPCTWLWMNMYIHANGLAATCGMDIREQWNLGNILFQNASEIWNSEQYKKVREAQFSLKDCIKFCKSDLSWSGNISYQKIEDNSLITVGPMYMSYSPLPTRSFVFGKNVEKWLKQQQWVSQSVTNKLAGIYRRIILK